MNCDDIKSKLKAFLDDLLAEGDYRAFCGHIETCGKCGNYARSIGSVSNQLWKLGRIRVPEDFCATLMYKIYHPELKERAFNFVIKKKHVIAGSALILLTITVFFVMNYFKNRQYKNDALIVKAEMILAPAAVKSGEAGESIKELEATAAKTEAPNATEGDFEEKNIVAGGPPAALENIVKDKAAAPEDNILHWHFLCSVKIEDAELKKEIQKTGLLLQKESERKELLSNEIERLQRQARQMEEERVSFKNIKKTESGQGLQNKSGLQKKLKEMKMQEDIVGSLSEEKQRIGLRLQNAAEEKQRKETERRVKLSDALSVLNISLEHEKNDILVFSADGEKAESALEQLMFISGDASSFCDFTANVPTFPDRKYEISVYLEYETAGAAHWHIGPITPGKKPILLDMIREYSGSFEYESDALVIFSIPGAEVEKLRNRIQAARISCYEYGFTKQKEDSLSSGPVTISVYFTK